VNKAYLLLGSNRNDPEKMLSRAEAAIRSELGNIIRASSRYKTAAWGNTEQPDFINQILQIDTGLSPQKLMEGILAIENKMGRVRTVKNAPRIIDIDILFYNNEVVNEKELFIPHPSIQDRRFVLVPLTELEPGLIHPVLGKTAGEMLIACQDPLAVDKI
jgi:2-amino-4-hydroxy-6-hydroxymethyldihydropteridine diphosphokinase